MYIRDLRIRNLKLLRDLDLSFADEHGKPRRWTVIIGENGTGKTSILQAIAMAAAGGRHVTTLVPNGESLKDKRAPKSKVSITAEFMLDKRLSHIRRYPGLTSASGDLGDVVIKSCVNVQGKDVVAESSYVDSRGAGDPLIAARQDELSLWFVAGYGVHRFLPAKSLKEEQSLERASMDRLRPIFQPVELVGTAFDQVLKSKKRKAYRQVLKEALFEHRDLLPMFDNLELRGQSARAFQERHLFEQELGSGKLKLPAAWLSHGYQSTIAWIADLVGHILWEAKIDKPLHPKEMEGLVLIDEIDLYLHPRWQRTLIQALKDTFPRIQFVATTHSPLALVGLRPDEDEIIRLTINKTTGDVEQVDMKRGQRHEPDPRLMTGSDIYREYFGIERFYPNELGNLLREHRNLAADPTRSDEDEVRLDQLEKQLRDQGIEPDFTREPREVQ
ncbi:MAG: AAA family ATPase [Polyangiaceae bacterium]|nr:AAA family ATPase [Polyangiaceae bacterium]